ncbi:MAG: zinc ribbon domain-containing protein, partial [Clostridiales bacterium]|nr:zinc ribbon domain-containing protein [Clostridiales bacterium]
YNNIFPALIDKNTFDGVQTILSQNKIGSRNPNSVYLLKNKIICGCCGNRYQGDCGTNPQGNTFYYYSCMGRKKLHICTSERLKKEVFENMINLLVNKIIVYKDKIEIFFNFTNRTPPTPPIFPEDTPDSLHRVSFSAVCSNLSNKCPPYSFGRHFAKRRNAARFIETNDIPPADSEKNGGGFK